MPQQPPDQPEFDWLYDGPEQQRGARTGSQPEHTQILPPGAVPPARPARPSQSPRPGTPRPPAGRPPGPPATNPSHGRRRPKLRLGRILTVALLAWVVYLIAVPVLAVQKVDTVAMTPRGDRPADQPGTNYLIVGSDSRENMPPSEARRLGTGGSGLAGRRTDTIMVLHTGAGPSLLLSIPRDSLVPIPGRGTRKINAAFAIGGAPLLVQTIEQNTGLRIDHFVEIGFAGFVDAVDAVGGITICPTMRMVDPDANLKIPAGCQPADGIKALGYARSRKVSALGDIDRAKRQREVVSAIGAKVKSPWTVLNPIRYREVINAGASTLRVDPDTGPVDLGMFAFAMTRVNGTDGLTCGMPIRDLSVRWDRERALALLGYLKKDRTDDIPARLCQPTGLPQ